MLKIPVETWNRLNEFYQGAGQAWNKTWPRVTSLHNGISVLLDLEKDAEEHGCTIELFRDHGTYGYRDQPVKAKWTFPDLDPDASPEPDDATSD